MAKKKLFLLAFLRIIFFANSIYAQSPMINNITWKIAASIPDISESQKQIGLAGLFVGFSNNVLLLAGGSNFPEGKPWEGYKKKYWNRIYAIRKNKNDYSCILLPDTLYNSLAYGACVSSKNGLVIIGGENEMGISNAVSILRWDSFYNKINFQSLSSLPYPLTNCSATIIDETIYLVGGENDGKSTSSFLSLKLEGNKINDWERLPPLPLALSHATIVTQSNGKEACIYVIGGRSSNNSGISDLHGNLFCYKPSTKSWESKIGLYNNDGNINLSAATGISWNSNQIILAGGDDGKTFSLIERLTSSINQAQNDQEKEQLFKQKMELINHHEGFSKKVYVYNTITDKWSLINDLPYAPVTTIAVKWGDEIIIPGGEIKPGIRTANILVGKITLSKD